jgi:hypothetical protein
MCRGEVAASAASMTAAASRGQPHALSTCHMVTCDCADAGATCSSRVAASSAVFHASSTRSISYPSKSVSAVEATASALQAIA